jgi:hypothetical protein
MALSRLGIYVMIGIWLAGCGTSTDEVSIPVTLFYNDVSLVIFNGEENELANLDQLSFIRGTANDGDDDFSGSTIPGNEIAELSCFRIAQQERTPLTPAQCETIQAESLVVNPETYFWRSEPDGYEAFEVRYNGRVISECNTVGRGETGECRFSLPTGS